MLVCLGLSAAPASAAASDGFFGVMPQKGVNAAELAQMKAGGIESLRVAVPWTTIEPARNTYTFNGLDDLVGNAARTGITVLPILYASPSWEATDSKNLPNTSVELNNWNAMLTTIVKRYGSQGSFWSNNPSIPKAPIGTWQIWNEQNTVWFVKPVRPIDYANLVIQSAATIRAQDPGARIMLGGMYSTPTTYQGVEAPAFLDSLYKVPGFESSFDGVAIHPYSSSIDISIDSISNLRTEMNQSGDAGKGIYVTEIGWGSDSRTSLGQGSQQAQARQLTGAYDALLANRESLGIRAVYWFAWKDAAVGERTCDFCYGTGLLDSSGTPKLAWNALTSVIDSQKASQSTPPPTTDSPATNAPVLAPCVVPKLTKKRIKLARRLLHKAHCRVHVVERSGRSARNRYGTVTSQSKKPSSVWPAGKKIRVVVARRKLSH